MSVCYCCNAKLSDKEIYEDRKAMDDKRFCKRCKVSTYDTDNIYESLEEEDEDGEVK